MLRHVSLWVLGLSAVYYYLALVFEYGEGAADLSLHEWLFILSAIVLIKRHYYYAKRQGYGFWRATARLLSALGILQVIALAFIGLDAWLRDEWAAYAEAIIWEVPISKETEIIDLMLALTALFFCIPTKCADTRSTAVETVPHPRNSSTLPPASQDATP